jgi:DNA-directed RNA polymerase subunit H (RpoH/RPB5)
MKAKKNSIIIEKHNLMPKHSICSEKEKEQILVKYNATVKEMPKMLINDAALSSLKVKTGDMIKIERNDPLGGKTYFYRVISDE